MTDKLPAPCEHCNASGIFRGIECEECSGKGYRLIIHGHLVVSRATEKARGSWRKSHPPRPHQQNKRSWTPRKP